MTLIRVTPMSTYGWVLFGLTPGISPEMSYVCALAIMAREALA